MIVLGKDATCENCVFWSKLPGLHQQHGVCHRTIRDVNANKEAPTADYYCGEWMNQEMWDARCWLSPIYNAKDFVSGESGYVHPDHYQIDIARLGIDPDDMKPKK